ncbi:hypothetical protein LTR29_012506 [Friedmanniomyces endolithicus]|nr:hypothetical protein LTR29_012506 [Friedmanniomyces endolithicus]
MSMKEGFPTKMDAEVEMLSLDGKEWQSRRCSVKHICRTRDALTGLAIIRLPEDVSKRPQDPKDLCTAFEMPPCTWLHQYQKATGFFLAQEGEQAGERTTYTTAFRFLLKHVTRNQSKSSSVSLTVGYSWTEIGIWTQWKPSHSSVMLCTVDNNDQAGVWKDICRTLQDPQATGASRPSDWHAFVLPYITAAFDRSVWACRDVVRHMEHHRPTAQSPRPDYPIMHELARHSVHISENLAMSIKVCDSIEQEISDRQRSTPLSGPAMQSAQTQALRTIRSQKTLLECAHGRSDALTARLQNEMNLVFHIGGERDSAIAAQMAQSMKQDSAAMKAISVLGLVFLPGTFVSAIFSMSFFHYSASSPSSAETWTVSANFWVYWATTIPLTMLTVLIWYLWHRRTLHERSYEA